MSFLKNLFKKNVDEIDEVENAHEISDSYEYSSFIVPLKQIIAFLLCVVLVVGVGIFIGDAIFGKRSYEVLKDLQKEKAFLYRDVERLKNENANLQKEFLEKKSLEADVKK